ncbi:MAG: PH domain-containing protein [Actinomycetota bacterium]|uniref:PH domain-containing protein n=1 Tax=Euzebya pacifica TaxID=1608957 RepID=UPI0030F54E34
MAYPKKLLNDNESVVLDLNPHWRIFLGPFALLVIALALVSAVVFWLKPDNQALEIASAVPAILALAWFVWRWIVWRSTHFVLTTDRVIYRSGVVSKQGQNIPLERITNVAFSQTVVERMLRVGDLRIESAGETGNQAFSDVLNPSIVENRIYSEIEKAKERDDMRAARAGVSVADELTKFERLRAQGTISEEEFQAQKARLLGQ